MKRRNFIRGMGITSAAMAVTNPLSARTVPGNFELDETSYGRVGSVEEAISGEGMLMVRVGFSEEPDLKDQEICRLLKIRKGKLDRLKTYFHHRVVVLWLNEGSEETEIILGSKEKFSITLGGLVETDEISGKMDGINVKSYLLLDREIGEINPAEAGIRDPGSDFSFVALADPQGGDPDDKNGLKTRMKIHNAFIQESVHLTNNLEFDPLFAVIIGDVCDDWGYKKDLAQMNTFLSKLKCPVLYGIGNHETLLRSLFEPGYKMEAFNNYFAAQKAINGIEKLLYSFNAGMWHFIVWPDPLRDNFWETHPHYFDWLERDLDKHQGRPTMVFQHVPSHPIGISPHINYAESVEVKRTFLEILARHGNVKYVLSGHVHIPVKASFKTAVTYKGIKMISLPAAGYRPRAFGEEDFYGGPSQGIALVHITGNRARIQFKTVTEEVYEYPASLPEFDQVAYPLWLKHPWELPSDIDFRNGDFSSGLENWARRYVYTEEVDPSNLCEVREAPDVPAGYALYLFCRRRAYQAPGQDRLPQDINRVSQAIETTKGKRPLIRFRYRIDGESTDLNGYAGGFVWIEGYSSKKKVFNMMYSAGKIWVNIGGKFGQIREHAYIQMALPEDTDIWHQAALNIADDFDRAERGVKYAGLGVDRLVLNLGVWNINDGEVQPFGIYFSGFSAGQDPGHSSQVNGHPVAAKSKEQEWWRNKIWPSVNMAGEHRYIIATKHNQ